MARSLVLAGPQRWQSEAYWMLHPGHDALAAYVLFFSGEGGEAMRRLRSRPHLDTLQQTAMDEIQEGIAAGEVASTPSCESVGMKVFDEPRVRLDVIKPRAEVVRHDAPDTLQDSLVGIR